MRFYEKTGCPVLINTSFNVRSEPIVCTPEDAYQCFMMTDMDVLVLGRHILLKDEQKQRVGREERARHLARFGLD
jgi:carbamoyltransferase